MSYKCLQDDGSTITKEEACGVAHFAQAWIMQGQIHKGLYISSQITINGLVLSAVQTYLAATADVTHLISALLKACFPGYYTTYQQAYDAGKCFNQNLGPYLERAVIYMMQGDLHKDKKDAGLSASFGVGQYTRGEIVFPQLSIKLRCDAHAICMFYASDLYHKVLPFTPAVQTKEQQEDNLVPGHIGTVTFNPVATMELLKDKPKNLGLIIGLGRYPFFMNMEK